MHKKYVYFYHLPPVFQISSIQTLSQIKSQEFIGNIKQHFMTTSHVTYVTSGIKEFVKCYIYQKLGTPQPSTQQGGIW